MPAHQSDLFDGLPLLPGLRWAEDFVSDAEERELRVQIDSAGLVPFQFHCWEGKRLTASFGHGYDFARGRLGEAPPVPAWLHRVRERAAAFAGLAAEALAQALAIRYDPGAGIGWHRDRPQFGTVIGISLGAAVVLRLRRRGPGGFERRALPLPPRSLYLLEGEARHGWEHSIAPVAATRWSITLRTLAVLSGAR